MSKEGGKSIPGRGMARTKVQRHREARMACEKYVGRTLEREGAGQSGHGLGRS